MIKKIDNWIDIIKDNPELFHDGIDEDLIKLLNDIKKYIEK